ncbi:hypothetical protein CGRA01v4_01187 [Colletotrichum graminicola]|nr:hypothetical protein CGRA01v4_01187 [Colletotrichum graminicola]
MPRKNNVSLCSHRACQIIRRLRALFTVSSCVCVMFAPPNQPQSGLVAPAVSQMRERPDH